MEERQLNFDAPILSARRYSLPSNSSKTLKQKVAEKISSNEQQSLQSNRSYFENEKVTKPGAVAFQWEEIPGTPKHDMGSQGQESGSPRHNPEERFYDQNIHGSQVALNSLSNHEHLVEKLNESLSCKDGSDAEYDTYSDAVVTLSRTESGGLNFRLSGRSSCPSSGVKSSRSFIIDEETRDLMMKKFLPGAWSAVIETREHVVKKSLLLDEHPKQVRREVSKDSMPSHNIYNTGPLPYYSRYTEILEAKDGKRNCIVPSKNLWKGWAVLPQLFAKNSVRHSNSSLQLKPRSVTPPPSTSKVHRNPLSKVRRLAAKAKSGLLTKIAFSLIHKLKFHSVCLPREIPQVEEDRLPEDPDQFMLNSRGSIKPESSPLNQYKSGVASPHQNEDSKSPLSCYRSGSPTPNRNECPKSPVSHHGSHCASPSRQEPPNAPLSLYGRHGASPYRNRLPKSPLGHHRRDSIPTYLNETWESPSRDYTSDRRSGYHNQSLKVPSHGVRFVDASEEADSHIADESASSQEPLKAMQEVSGNQMRKRRSSGPMGDDASVKTLYIYSVKSSYKNAGGPVISYDETEEHASGKYDSSASISDSEEEEKLCHKFRSLASSNTVPPKVGHFADAMEDIKSSHSCDQGFRTMECISKVKCPLPPPLPNSPTHSWNNHAQSRRTIHSKG